MALSLEIKSLAYALLVSFVSLGGAWLIASPIQRMTGPGAAQEPALEITTAPGLADQGREFFGQSCSQCHGDDARGDEGPDLHGLPISNAHIASTIKKGIKGEMPSFSKKYNDRQIATLVSYLRSLR